MIIFLNLEHIILKLKILERHLLTKLFNLIILLYHRYFCFWYIIQNGMLKVTLTPIFQQVKMNRTQILLVADSDILISIFYNK